MWIAKNKQTGREYTLTDEQKKAYEASPHTRGKYSFRQQPTPKGVAATKPENVKPPKGQVEPEQGL